MIILKLGSYIIGTYLWILIKCNISKKYLHGNYAILGVWFIGNL